MTDLVDELAGTWHIVATTFPMWLDGSRTNPTFTYTPRGDVMDDDVAFRTRRGRARHIRGVDTRTGPRSFRWRGAGLLRPLRSDWRVSHLASDSSWAVVEFDRTMFTPAGVDVITRARRPSAATWAEVDRVLADLGHDGVTRIG
ncbi:hypothetical protein [Knoellia remsis]|uniref:hypothetical protein n=1 Tax=Knoellia remsis TaxID=407159 RepID=UPI0011B22ED4|nr:hypothetical protein [Knoellia remsis]